MFASRGEERVELDDLNALQTGDVLIAKSINGFHNIYVVNELSERVPEFEPSLEHLQLMRRYYSITKEGGSLDDFSAIPDAVDLRVVFHKKYGMIRQAMAFRAGSYTWINMPLISDVYEKTRRAA